MDVTADELAGIVDLFGGLSRSELERALSEAAFRDGGSIDETGVEETIEDARERFALVRFERGGATSGRGDGNDDETAFFVAGPTAFPSVPEAAEDLPYILDLEPRQFDRDALGEQVRERYVRDVSAALDAGDEDRVQDLLDVSYDLEAWAPIDLAAERRRLDEELE